MDVADIQRRAAAAREFEQAVGERSFRLRIPTQHETQVEILRAGGGEERTQHVALALMQRAVIERAIIGWRGVTTGDLLPDESVEYETVDYVPVLVPLLLDAQPEIGRALTEALVSRVAERNAKIEAARKN
jgi:hypothetical protein